MWRGLDDFFWRILCDVFYHTYPYNTYEKNMGLVELLDGTLPVQIGTSWAKPSVYSSDI